LRFLNFGQFAVVDLWLKLLEFFLFSFDDFGRNGLFMNHVFFDGNLFKDREVKFFVRNEVSHDREKVRRFENVLDLKCCFLHVDAIEENVVQIL
jgi:hypothetical protein